MKVDVTYMPKTLDGEPFTRSADEHGVTHHTVGTIAIQALLSPPTEQGEKLDGETSFRRGKLAEKIHNAKGEVDLTAEEISEIKKLAGKVFLPSVILPLYEALENPAPVAVAKEA